MTFDFNTATSPTAGGDTGVTGTTTFPNTNGYGWLSTVITYDRTSPASNAFLEDFAYGTASTPGTFEANLAANTTYTITATVGDAGYLRDRIDIQSGTVSGGNFTGGSDVLGGNYISSAAGQFVTRTFNVTTGASGLLALQFSEVPGGSQQSGTPIWVVNGLNVRPQVTPFTLTPSSPTGPADGSTPITFSATVPNGTYTVSTTNGTITTADGNANYAGTQVVVTTGTLSFNVTSTMPGAVAVTAYAVDGSANGSGSATFLAAVSRRFDFNNAVSPTATGFIGVPGTVYNSSVGYGWTTAPVTFDRTSLPEFNDKTSAAVVTTKLYEDGNGGSVNTPDTFEVAVNPGGTYTIRAYVGDAQYARSGEQISLGDATDGYVTTTVPSTAIGHFTWVTLTDSNLANDGGILNIIVNSTGAGATTWVINGLDVFQGTLVGGNDPGAAPQLAVGGAVTGGNAPVLTQAQLAPVVKAALADWAAAGLSTAQLAKLAGVQYQITDLGASGDLGLTALGSQVVQLDDNGDGRGWYVDASPASTAAFGVIVGPGERDAAASSPAAGLYDLKTVVEHEQAHVLGLGDLNPTTVPHDLLTETLATGVRRQIQSSDLPGGSIIASAGPLSAAANGASVAVAQPQLALAAAEPSAQDLVFATQPETFNALLLTRAVPLELSQTTTEGPGPQISLGEARVLFNGQPSRAASAATKGAGSPKSDDLDASGWFKQADE